MGHTGGLPDHFRSVATHIDGKVVLLRTNTQKAYVSKIWHQHRCDMCLSLESGYGGSQSAPYNPPDGGSL